MPMNFSNLPISLSELGHWAKEQSVAEVPADLAFCEFDCRKSHCSWDEWVGCERRISKAAGELMPPSFNRNGAALFGGLEAMVER